jgi:lipoprotein NlpI
MARWPAHLVALLLAGLVPGVGGGLVQAGEPPSAPAPEAEAERWYGDGVRLFLAADPAGAVAAFDRSIAASPAAAPQLWQRGIALYYAGRFADGRRQFELHRQVNPDDVENAAWHFLCVARSADPAAARAALIPVSGDARVPMREIWQLYAGSGSAEAVLAAADDEQADAAQRRESLFYAHLYLGLHDEAMSLTESAKRHLLLAAYDFRMDHYMGRVAQIHVQLRGWSR